MTAVRIAITTTEYLSANFSWYEIFASETNLALGAVVAGAEYSDLGFSTSFIHPNLIAGDTWYYWVRAAYDHGGSYSSLRALGSVTVTGSGGGVSGVSGSVEFFIDLGDVPGTYAGAGGKYVAVKASVDGLEFVTAPSGASAGTPPDIVQFKSSLGSKSVTLDVAPTNGNYLVALCKANNGSQGAGWTQQDLNAGGTNYNQVNTKLAGAAESATQTPLFSDDNADAIFMFEVTGQSATPVVFANATVLSAGSFFFTCGPSGPLSDGAPTSLPGMENVLVLAVIFTDGTTPQTLEAAMNMTQDELNNSGTYTHFVAGHSDGATAVAQLLSRCTGATIATRACIIHLKS